MLPRGAALDAGDLSLLSWNLLADCYAAGSESLRYVHVPPTDLAWGTRCRRIVDEILSAQADVVCLQEVMFSGFEADLQGPLAAAGYVGRMQNERKRDPTHPIGNATFWKEPKLKLCRELSRSRTFITILEDAQARRVAVVNCHLEGGPGTDQSLTRIKQLQGTLKQLQQQQHHAVLVVGDFNCELQSSGCASYLAFGTVLPGVIEWGQEVPAAACEVAGHGYQLASAYSDSDADFSFTIRGGGGYMLDQLWHTPAALRCTAARALFASEEQRLAVLARGLPSDVNPSDHLPVGAAFAWQSQLAELGAAQAASAAADDDPAAEAELLLANCPWTEAQRSEWEAANCLPELPKRQKPSPEQLALLQSLKERRERLLAEVSEEARQILQRVVELQKRAKKAAQKAASQ